MAKKPAEELPDDPTPPADDDLIIDWDQVFETEQTPDAKMKFRCSVSTIYRGRPHYPLAEYEDSARIAQTQVGDDESTLRVIVEPEEVLRERVIATTLRLFNEGYTRSIEQFEFMRDNGTMEGSA